MPIHNVNLDALIFREDFETENNPDTVQQGTTGANFLISELLEGASMFGVLRKPDFQRDTSNWKPEMIAELIKNFVDGELIPAVILWKAPNRTIFVIDGAHRLSALIAWVNDDFGDKQLSNNFFGDDNIPVEQKQAAEATRYLVNSTVGSYQFLRGLISRPSGGTSQQVERGRNLASVPVVTQWVTGDAGHAEVSFSRINQGGAVIDETEKEIIQSRRTPEALAARALLRAGTGHRYWSAFDGVIKAQIESLAREIYDMFFKPGITDPIRTLDLPIAGRGYSGESLRILYEFIHIANNLKRDKKGAKKEAIRPLDKNDPRNDKDGLRTVKYLKVVKNIAELISSNRPKSLGLHPAVYSYSATGRFQPTAFFAQVALVQFLEETRGFDSFTDKRELFEEFLVDYKYFVNQLVGGYGSMTRGLQPLLGMYKIILSGIINGKSEDDVKNDILKDESLSMLKEKSDSDRHRRKNFSTETKAAVRLKTELQAASRCAICGARLHANSTSIDHITRKQDGGVGNEDNGQVTHPYCNTGYKEKHVAKSIASRAPHRAVVRDADQLS